MKTPGFRSGLAAIVFAMLFPTLLTWVYFVAMADRSESAQQLTYSVGKVIQFGFPIFFFVVCQRRRPDWRWPSTQGIGLGFGFGLLVVAAMFACFFFVLKPFGLFEQANVELQKKVEGFGLDSVWAFVGLGLFYSLFHSFLEEYYWRWFVFGQLRQWSSFSVATILSSLGFMAHHVVVLAVYFGWDSPLTYLLSISVAVGGAVWAWIYERTKTLYSPWLSHLVVDAGIFLLGYEILKRSL